MRLTCPTSSYRNLRGMLSIKRKKGTVNVIGIHSTLFDAVWLFSDFFAKNMRLNDLNRVHVFSDFACGFRFCGFVKELKQATFLSHGRQPVVNISHARTVVSPRF